MRSAAVLGILVLLALACGCYSPAIAIAGRSAIEEEVTTAAVRHTIEKLSLQDGPPKQTRELQVAVPRGSDEAVIRARLEERLAQEGWVVGPAADGDAPVLTAVVPFAGADTESSLWGIPLFVPGVPVMLGDLSLYRSNTIRGRARVELWTSGSVRPLAVSEGSRYYRTATFFTFIGPFRFTDLNLGPPPGEER